MKNIRTASGRSAGGNSDNSKEFNNHFTSIYGKRWIKLYASLMKDVQHVALQNAFVGWDICAEAGLEAVFSTDTFKCFK